MRCSEPWFLKYVWPLFKIMHGSVTIHFGQIYTSHLPWQILPFFSKPFKHIHSNEPFKLLQKEFFVQLLNPNIHSLISLHVFPSTLIWYPDGHSQWTLPTVLLQIAGEIQPSVFSVHSSISKVEIYFVKCGF